MNDERRKVLTKYLGLCWHEGRMPINCGFRCVKCGDTYVVNRTFTTDADMMDLFRKLTDKDVFNFHPVQYFEVHIDVHLWVGSVSIIIKCMKHISIKVVNTTAFQLLV